MGEFGSPEGHREQCMQAVRKLPLLEDVEVGLAAWSEEDLGLLLPPHERLKRLMLAWPVPFASLYQSSGTFVPIACEVASAVEQLESYGIHVVLRQGVAA